MDPHHLPFIQMQMMVVDFIIKTSTTCLLVSSTVLALVCICFTSIMLAGSSDNSSVLQNCEWGQASWGKIYFGTTTIVVKEDYDWSSSIGGGDDFFNGGDLESKDLPYSYCIHAGMIANAMTSTTFVLTVAVFVVLIFRLTKVLAPSYRLSLIVLSATILALICDVVAIGYFNHKCLGGLEMVTHGAKPGVSMDLGFAMVFLLSIICALQTVECTTAVEEVVNDTDVPPPSYDPVSVTTPGRIPLHVECTSKMIEYI